RIPAIRQEGALVERDQRAFGLLAGLAWRLAEDGPQHGAGGIESAVANVRRFRDLTGAAPGLGWPGVAEVARSVPLGLHLHAVHSEFFVDRVGSLGYRLGDCSIRTAMQHQYAIPGKTRQRSDLPDGGQRTDLGGQVRNIRPVRLALHAAGQRSVEVTFG